jgi:hypothetical protein
MVYGVWQEIILTILTILIILTAPTTLSTPSTPTTLSTLTTLSTPTTLTTLIILTTLTTLTTPTTLSTPSTLTTLTILTTLLIPPHPSHLYASLQFRPQGFVLGHIIGGVTLVNAVLNVYALYAAPGADVVSRMRLHWYISRMTSS